MFNYFSKIPKFFNLLFSKLQAYELKNYLHVAFSFVYKVIPKEKYMEIMVII